MKFVCRDKKQEYRKDLTLKCAEFICSELGIKPNQVKGLPISLQSIPSAESGKLIIKKPSSPNAKPSIRIALDKGTSLVYSIKTLCHELVHLKQYLDGRLIPIDDDCIEWVSESGNITRHTLIDTPLSNSDEVFEEYKAQPWEAEAYQLQEVLMTQVKERFKDYEIELSIGVSVPVF
ncbi:hypothetical protein [Vibrio sp. D431a]|uniref:hypothetical protein n=1 Tax=Vibrio sp. D431a TaxID=2837388 RepID=UPI002554E9AB|nr:hypothetical protein [Vibrio sp. D431a]MDK9793710.1 hypothetical protein [Vibrio sp. D431a]